MQGTFNIVPQNFIGFDRIIDSFFNPKFASIPAMVPYNVVKIDDENYKIEMAAAGYNKDDFDISVANNILSIKITKTEEQQGSQYLYQGISKRSYLKEFALADTVEVVAAEFKNGLLTVDLKNKVPEKKKAKQIDIK